MAKAKTPTNSADDKKWQAESDMRTLSDAVEIAGDKKRTKAALAVAKEKMGDLKKIPAICKMMCGEGSKEKEY